MTNIFHRGIPCVPPIVNGIEFKPSEDHDGLFVGEATPEAVALFDGIPGFNADPEALKLVAEETPAEAPKGIADPDHDPILVGLKADLEKTSAALVDANAKVETLEAENEELRARVSELEAELDNEQEEDVQKDGVDSLKADIAALEAKKAEKGKLSPAETKKLEKLQKRLAELAASAQ